MNALTRKTRRMFYGDIQEYIQPLNRWDVIFGSSDATTNQVINTLLDEIYILEPGRYKIRYPNDSEEVFDIETEGQFPVSLSLQPISGRRMGN